jgi:hypothetical protein
MALPPGRSRFCATCGVTFRFRHSATKSAVSYPLSPPPVDLFRPSDLFQHHQTLSKIVPFFVPTSIQNPLN